jgi:Protein of unknown function (DUF2628)
VKIWTAHEKPRAAPVLVREGFSFGALFFGPFWLAAHRAWLPAAAAFAVGVLIVVLSRPPASIVLTLGLAFLLGLSGRDLVRWSVARRGYLESAVVVGTDADDARAKLFAARPDLVERSMVAETAP